MKLRNKKTGEIAELVYIASSDGHIILQDVNTNEFICKYGCLATLKSLAEEWEDYEEPKKHYEILSMGAVMEREDAEDEIFRNQGQKEIGNYFSSREEAELAVRKLKAWKRLKDKGLRFSRWTIPEEPKTPHIKLVIEAEMDVPDSPYDLDLLFWTEEDG